jgi:hypothetical protein
MQVAEGSMNKEGNGQADNQDTPSNVRGAASIFII